MTAAEVKDALRRRHPAVADLGGPGPWTVTEEWANVDLLAWAAWTQPKPARCRHARIGYEVKVGRADYRRELARPEKRAAAVAMCHEFYIAVPAGLVKPEEAYWREPTGWPAKAAPFERMRCLGAYGAHCSGGRLQLGVQRVRPPDDGLPRPWWNRSDYSRAYDAECPTCRGTGWLAESPAVLAGAPHLWVPADVGLLEVHDRGCVVVRKAPLNLDPRPVPDGHINQLVRWVSVRPDPRHRALTP